MASSIPHDASKVFAIAGPGNSTELIIDELLKYKEMDPKIEVRILTREGSSQKPKEDDWVQQGAKIYTVVYSPPHRPPHDSLLQALDGAQIIISGIGIEDPFIQAPLALAALEASAPDSIFFPFEFGAAADPIGDRKITRGTYLAKRAFRDWLEDEVGWSKRWIALHTGWYMEEVFGSFIGFDVLEGDKEPTVTIYGDGNSPTSWTARSDIATFIAHTLVGTPRSKLLSFASLSPTRQNAFRIEGDRVTMNELLSIVLDARKEVLSTDNSDVVVKRIPSAELNNMWERDDEERDFVIDMLAVYDQGFGVTGPTKGGNWREWWTEWNPRSLKDVARRKLLAISDGSPELDIV